MKCNFCRWQAIAIHGLTVIAWRCQDCKSVAFRDGRTEPVRRDETSNRLEQTRVEDTTQRHC